MMNNYTDFEFQQNDLKNNCGNLDSKEILLKKIMAYKFSIIELALYLDTHPCDENAICMHIDYARKYKELCDKYQKFYGPLTINYPNNKWKWINLPWPWEKEAY